MAHEEKVLPDDPQPSDPAPPPRPAGVPDRDRRILDALGDPVAVSILSALSKGERDGHALVVDTHLPQSSIYRKLHDLQDGGLVYVRRLAFTREGRKVELYSSRIRQISVEFVDGITRVRIRAREDSADRISELWARVRGK